MENMACLTLVLVKIFPNVRHNLQKNLENSCTQVDEVTLMRPTISISCGKLWRETRIKSSSNVGEVGHLYAACELNCIK